MPEAQGGSEPQVSVTSSQPPRAALASRILVLALAGIFLLGVVGFLVAVISASEDPQRSPPPTTSARLGVVGSSHILLAVADLAPADPPLSRPFEASSPEGGLETILELGPSLAPSPAASPLEADGVTVMTEQSMPVVPVVRFWSKKAGISRADIVRALEDGELRGYKRIIVGEGMRDALAASLSVSIHDDVAEGDAAMIERAISRGALGLLAATEVAAPMRALMINGISLFGNDRTRDAASWPLQVSVMAAQGDGWDQAATWVLVAGGDSFTDRGVYDSVVRQGRGVDYPFDGGTARVTGHGCCDPVFNDNVVPRYVLTGNKGAVRKLFRGAELAITNHEQPVTEQAGFHSSGTRFSGKPGLTRIFTRAGIDWVSLANNHIKDYGSDGIKDTRRILGDHGIGFSGAGKNLKQARQVSYLQAGDTKVAIIPCLGIVRQYWADTNEAGATPCLDRYLVPDIRQAKREADIVIVFPHWGVEYTRQPLSSMRKHAGKWVKAGADLVLGGHSHVAGAIEDIDGSPVLYSLGNLIFDQNWSTNTMESMLLEATFQGGRLIQLDLRPYIIHDKSQPNFLDPAKGEGRRLLQQVRKASSDWLDW